MLVKMKHQEFNSLDPITLAQKCIEPTLQQLHAILPPTERWQIISQLTPGQQALFLFHVLYDHAGDSAADLYICVSQLLAEPHKWSAIKASSRYFGDDSMLQLLEQLEVTLQSRHQKESIEQAALPWDLDRYPQLNTSLMQLNATYHEIALTSLKLMGTYIRNHPDEFVLLED
jgi:hypothetical protein